MWKNDKNTSKKVQKYNFYLMSHLIASNKKSVTSSSVLIAKFFFYLFQRNFNSALAQLKTCIKQF